MTGPHFQKCLCAFMRDPKRSSQTLIKGLLCL